MRLPKLTFVLLITTMFPTLDCKDCTQLHPSCLFVAAVGLSGSTTLMDVLNQHPQIHLRGENLGLYNNILSVITNSISWETNYESALAQREWKVVQNFSTISQEHATKGVAMMYKHFFGSGQNENKMIGFKEIRFRHPEQIDFVRSLCQQSKVIFQYHTDIQATARKGWYTYDPNATTKIMEQINLFNAYHSQHPNDTYISILNDFRKPDFLQNLFSFLDLDLEGVNIDIERLYKISKIVKANQHARQRRYNFIHRHRLQRTRK